MMQRVYEKEKQMNCNRNDLILYAVTDRSWIGERTLWEDVESALKGGTSFIQLREKELGEEALREEALVIQKLCAKYRVPFLLNDNVRLAHEIDADGVHVGQKDMDAASAREILGPDKIIGVSVRTVEQAVAAQEKGADYLGVGAVFPTGSKSDAVEVDHEVVRQICDAVDIPVIAIGGINRDNVLQLKGTGVCGIAVISAIFAQKDIEAAARELKMLAGEMISDD